jgi:hypothetical protein
MFNCLDKTVPVGIPNGYPPYVYPMQYVIPCVSPLAGKKRELSVRAPVTADVYPGFERRGGL